MFLTISYNNPNTDLSIHQDFSMSVYVYLFLWLSLTVSIKAGANDGVIVQEVSVGDLAELPCPSSDDQHRFMYWELADNRNLLGPGNPLNEKKYNYEVLTGKLFIRGISTAESGFYRCVSRGIEDNSAINMQKIELIVKKDLEVTSDNDCESKLLGGIVVMTVLAVVVVAVLLIIIIITRKKRRFFAMEESRENSPSTYRGDQQSVSRGDDDARATPDADGFDNLAIDVDFPKVFKQMQK